MTHAHINPGYHDYESNINRAKNNPQLLSSNQYQENTAASVPVAELDNIKDWAKGIWSKRDTYETTYQYQYPAKSLLERTISAPTEGERKNKPHPKQLFLTNRLHYVPGYHNADTTLGKSPYKIDRSVGTAEFDYRRDLKGQYIGRPSTAALRQFAPTEQEDITKWTRTLPPNDSWMAAASYRDRQGMAQSLSSALSEAGNDVEPSKPIASHYRYLKLAGAEERERIRKALDAKGDPEKVPNMMIPYQEKGTIHSRHQQDRANVQKNPNKPFFRYPRPRGDYLIHPAWPPSVWHHRIPGFRAQPPVHPSPYDIHQQTVLSGIY